MTDLTTKQLEDLKKPLPAEAVKQHPTKTYLSSIKAIYVTERMNEVFGVGKWQIKTNHVANGEKGMVVVKVEFSVPENGIYYESFGGNDNGGEDSKNFDLGDAYKGATTDAITKIGSYLGIGIDVFKGKNTPAAPPAGGSAGNNQKPEPTTWLNLFDKEGNKLKAYTDFETAIAGGKTFTLAQIRESYKVSKVTAEELKTNFNIQ